MIASMRRISVSLGLMCVLLATSSPAAVMRLAAQELSPVKTINLQLIVDSSGSMAAPTDTGELRIDAAKRVLAQVISEIPNVEGVNVGLRVYGHEGNNTDAGKAESCISSELLVPMEGVDAPRLIEQVNALQPVGWTPLGYSLQESAKDFTQPASENVVNAIVMVTDGLETCDADPVAIAGQLRNSEGGITTHVIGFGTTPEEQAILNGIAQAGSGQLLGAANASELTAALFDVLEELEVVQGVGFVGGDALSVLPQGEPGVLSPIAVGSYDGNLLPIVVRNNTGEDVIRITAVASAMNPAGQLTATGNSQMFNPNIARSGGVSIGYAYFGGTQLPPDTTFEIALDAQPATDHQFENIRDLEIVEASAIEGRVVGTAQNTYDVTLAGPIGFAATCFDQAGTLLAHMQGFSSQQQLAPDETLAFQVDNFSGSPCPLFLVAGSAWDNSFGPSNDIEPPGNQEEAAQADATAVLRPGAPTEVIPPVAASTSSCADLASPEEILLALQSAGLPIGEYDVYTAATDPNGLLGRPLQYTGKLVFRDTTLQPLQSQIEMGDGGTIEVFDSAEHAQARYDYVMDVIATTPILAHYLYLEDTLLLRVSGRLMPDQAAVYGEALEAVVSCSGGS